MTYDELNKACLKLLHKVQQDIQSFDGEYFIDWKFIKSCALNEDMARSMAFSLVTHGFAKYMDLEPGIIMTKEQLNNAIENYNG